MGNWKISIFCLSETGIEEIMKVVQLSSPLPLPKPCFVFTIGLQFYNSEISLLCMHSLSCWQYVSSNTHGINLHVHVASSKPSALKMSKWSNNFGRKQILNKIFWTSFIPLKKKKDYISCKFPYNIHCNSFTVETC